MKRLLFAGAMLAGAITASATEQVAYSLTDYVTYHNESSRYSFMEIGQDISSLTLTFGKLQDGFGGEFGYYTYTGTMSEKDLKKYIDKNHTALAKGSTTINLENLAAGTKIGFYLKKDYGILGSKMVYKFDFGYADTGKWGNQKLGSSYAGASSRVYFGEVKSIFDLAKMNDWVEFEKLTVRFTQTESTVEGGGNTPSTQPDTEITFAGEGGDVVEIIGGNTGPVSTGAPLPGVLAALLLAGGCGGVAVWKRKRRKG